jgi:3-hydroxyisobutyrate dehydrogenase
VVIDLSTIGVSAAQTCNKILNDCGITYVDAPVSGGQRGAKAGTLTLMVATESEMLDYIRPVLSLFSKNIFYIGRTPGQGQAMKLINNFLAGSVLTVTTEALVAGLKAGLDLKQMIDVINVSTGQNFMTSHVYPESVLTDQFDSGFMNSLLLKDLSLYAEMVNEHGWPDILCSRVLSQWKQFERDWPAKDVTHLFNYVRDHR